MSYLGWFLAVCGLALVVFGVLKMLKAKKMGTVPFRKPSEIMQRGPQAADPQGMVSTEGQVNQGPQPLQAPMSGQPCLAYEITIERKWEKHVVTEKGNEKKTGTDKAHSEFRGSFFQVTDGAGAVLVDATGQCDAEMEKAHSSTVSVGNMIPGTLTFGRLQMNTPHINSNDSRTTAFVGTEKILKVSPTVYALGQMAQGPQGMAISTPKGMGTGKLILSAKGREALLGKTKLHMILGYAFGGVLTIGGTLLGILGPKPVDTSCAAALTGETTCNDRMTSKAGKTYAWTVDKAGAYEIRVSQPKVKNPIYATISISDSANKEIDFEYSNAPGQDTVVRDNFAAGTYKLQVADRDDYTVQGGFGFSVNITHLDKPVDGGGIKANPDAGAAAGAIAAADAGAKTDAGATVVKVATAGNKIGAPTTPKGAVPAVAAPKPAPAAPGAKPAVAPGPAPKPTK